MKKLKKIPSAFPGGLLLKFLVSAGIIIWLASQIDKTRLWEITQKLHVSPLLWAFLLMGINLLAVAKRWELITRLGNTKLFLASPFFYLAKATFIGAFFNQFLPSSVGGDFYRILSLRRQGVPLAEAASGVAADRLCGFISFSFLLILALFGEGQILLNSVLKWPLLSILFLLAAITGGGFLLLLIPASYWHCYSFLRPFSPVVEMMRNISGIKLFLPIALMSLMASLLLVSALQTLTEAFEVPLSWSQGIAIFPAVMLLGSLPISFAGWGLREGAMILALGVYGIPAETALSLSLIYGIMQLIAGLPGLVFWLMEKRLPKPENSLQR